MKKKNIPVCRENLLHSDYKCFLLTKIHDPEIISGKKIYINLNY